MLTIKEAEEILQKEYHIDNFLYLIKNILLPDFKNDVHSVEFKNEIFSKVEYLGCSEKCEVSVFEVVLFNCKGDHRRVAITQEMFKILKGMRINNAIIAFVNPDRLNYRISLLTSKYEYDGDKVIKVLSNPRRFSYSLGYGTKTKTAYQYLIEKGKVNNLDELIERFSVEVVNKQFYREIALCYTQLVGGEREGKKYEKQLNLYGLNEESKNKFSEFAVRLIGRLMFCWFLKEKKSDNNIPLIPEDMLSLDNFNQKDNYYHRVLEPLFFEVLNTNIRSRKPEFQTRYYSQIPYLNGGLFSEHDDDQYEYDNAIHCGKFGKVTIPNIWFQNFYAILNQYNFTVDENTSYDIELSIDPEMLGRIFENLLAEINPTTGENKKKSTGSYYTPREIVDYMVDTSLCEYLKSKTGIDEIKLKALISYNKEDDGIAIFNDIEKNAIVDALYNIKILDPACGSGAFPIGMLQKVVYVLQEIDPAATQWLGKITANVEPIFRKAIKKKFTSGLLNYIRKLSVIQNSIFGVDIQSIAVEISRLRCFLSLVIEEQVDDNKENRGIESLPNLDFKFITANSLVKLEGDGLGLLEDQKLMNKLKNIRDEYFSTSSSADKKELASKFQSIQQDMLLNIIEVYKGIGGSDRYFKLSSWKPFENKLTDWFDADWMFGIKDGFDIIIGNPPYVQLQKMKDESNKLSKMGYRVFERTGDLYCLFYEFGINNLKENGILCYITSNKWMRAGYGESLRKFFVENTNPILLIDFYGEKVFESATVDVNILMAKKEQNQEATKACIIKENCLKNLSNYIEQNSTISKIGNAGDSWIILNPIEQSIKDKIEQYGTPLKNWNIEINYGIKTGCNEAFIIDEDTKDKLIAEDPKSAEIIRPILRGKDIKKYSYNFANLYLINTHNGLKDKGISPIDVNNYPAIKKHLDKYYDAIAKRYDKGDTPYNLRNCVYMDDFFEQVIAWQRITQKNKFCLTDKGLFVLDSMAFIAHFGKYKNYLLAILNSKLIMFWIQQNVHEYGNTGYRLANQYVELMPVNKAISNGLLNKFDKLIEQILKTNDMKLQNSIDTLIYELYNLSNNERNYIEKKVINLN